MTDLLAIPSDAGHGVGSAGQAPSAIGQMQPLIVLGMHRSGTSLTVRLLVDLGIHMGSWLSRDAESVHFQRLNRRVYGAARSKWAAVDPLVEKMRSSAFVDGQTQATERALLDRRVMYRRPVIADFFGRELWEAIGRGESPAWGWKDPRTILTFPIWLSIFPQARWVHILRNGIDVAISIHRRSLKQYRKLRNRLFPIDFSAQMLDFEDCFHLWEKCLSFALEHKPLIPAGQYMELRYEDLLAEPEVHLRQLLEFAGHSVSEEAMARACQRINAGRLDNARHAVQYREQIPALVSSPIMRQLGYCYSLAPLAGTSGTSAGKRWG
jgi:hypothetical protein